MRSITFLKFSTILVQVEPCCLNNLKFIHKTTNIPHFLFSLLKAQNSVKFQPILETTWGTPATVHQLCNTFWVTSFRTIFDIVGTPEGLVTAWCTCAPQCALVHSFLAFYSNNNSGKSFTISNFALTLKSVGAPMLGH